MFIELAPPPPPATIGEPSCSGAWAAPSSTAGSVWTDITYDPEQHATSHTAVSFPDWERTWDGVYPLGLVYAAGWARASNPGPPPPPGTTYRVMREDAAVEAEQAAEYLTPIESNKTNTIPFLVGTYTTVAAANNHAMAYVAQCTQPSGTTPDELDRVGGQDVFRWTLLPSGCVELVVRDGVVGKGKGKEGEGSKAMVEHRVYIEECLPRPSDMQ